VPERDGPRLLVKGARRQGRPLISLGDDDDGYEADEIRYYED